MSLCCCFAIAAASFLIVSASSGVLAVIRMVITPGFSSRATWIGVSSSSIVIMYLTFGCFVIADCKLTTLAMFFTPYINLCGWVVLFGYVCLLLVGIHPRRVEAAGLRAWHLAVPVTICVVGLSVDPVFFCLLASGTDFKLVIN